jgi:Domain of unknown function (DUF4209)
MRRGKHGGLRWASLEEILDEAAVEEALGPGLAATLRRLYLDPFGPNYRNEIAHGAADPREKQLEWARLTAFGILSVALRLVTVGHSTATDVEGQGSPDAPPSGPGHSSHDSPG